MSKEKCCEKCQEDEQHNCNGTCPCHKLSGDLIGSPQKMPENVEVSENQERDEATRLLREARSHLHESGPIAVTALYISPAQQLRNAANDMEAKDNLIRRIDEFLKANPKGDEWGKDLRF